MADERDNIPDEDSAEKQLEQIIAADSRYARNAYIFVYDALKHTQKMFSQSGHVSGQNLCEGLRDFALKKFGMMAKAVLNEWGIRKTEDIGEIVFNLVDGNLMRTTEEDSIEDFTERFDLDEAFIQNFKFDRPLNLD